MFHSLWVLWGLFPLRRQCQYQHKNPQGNGPSAKEVNEEDNQGHGGVPAPRDEGGQEVDEQGDDAE